jgi:hypothetical protein
MDTLNQAMSSAEARAAEEDGINLMEFLYNPTSVS